MPPFHSINIAGPARVSEIHGGASLLGALPAHTKPLAPAQRLENHRICLEAGARVVLEVEGAENLTLDAPVSEPRTYFLHVVDAERIRHSVAMK